MLTASGPPRTVSGCLASPRQMLHAGIILLGPHTCTKICSTNRPSPSSSITGSYSSSVSMLAMKLIPGTRSPCSWRSLARNRPSRAGASEMNRIGRRNTPAGSNVRIMLRRRSIKRQNFDARRREQAVGPLGGALVLSLIQSRQSFSDREHARAQRVTPALHTFHK